MQNKERSVVVTDVYHIPYVRRLIPVPKVDSPTT